MMILCNKGILLQRVTVCCCKVRQVLQNVTDCYYRVLQVLKNVTDVITECVGYYKV